MSNLLANGLRNTALELGFDRCGIVRIEAVAEFEQKLDERIRECSRSALILEALRKYARPQEKYPWAKAVVVCITDYSKYIVPKQLQGIIGKYYLYDHRLQPNSIGGKRIYKFEQRLDRFGLKWATDVNGVTAGRFAAAQAGLGVIRKNNFFYTEKGSRTIIDTWVIDKELEWLETRQLVPCPKDCDRCIKACPTKALTKPYCLDLSSCAAYLTYGVRDLIPMEQSRKLGSWIYGCDQCQDACPINQKNPPGTEEYPGIKQLADEISLQSLVEIQSQKMKEKLLSKFYFIQPDQLWLWKVNALRAMVNNYQPKYREIIYRALNNENIHVREFANEAMKVLGA